MAPKPLCFVLMPFGKKADPRGGPSIDFDAIYERAVGPGIEDAGLEPIRADEERTGGIIHIAMFERLILCEYAVADLTTANANVFYELGVRHAMRPHTTLPLFAQGQNIPFDVNHLRALPYALSERNELGSEQETALRESIAKRLSELREEVQNGEAKDSPVFQLLKDLAPPEVSHLKTDTFREQVAYAETTKAELRRARKSGSVEALADIESKIGAIDEVEAGVAIDLYLSWRAIKEWDRMVDLYQRMPAALQRVIMVREQLGFALNRLGKRDEAREVLAAVIEEVGPNPETNGLLGRVEKDAWLAAVEEGSEARARGLLRKAIATYSAGFEADWRDAYPGINAVTLLDIEGSRGSLKRRDELLPLVMFAVERRLASTTVNYWDHATLLELAVLRSDEDAARDHLADALAATEEPWEPETTAKNLGLIRDARRQRGELESWLEDVIGELEEAS